MTDLAQVDHANADAIYLSDTRSRVYRESQSNFYLWPAGTPTVSALPATGRPDIGIYELLRDSSIPAHPAHYYNKAPTYQFQGTPNSPTATVVEDLNRSLKPIDDIYKLKLAELDDYANTVFFSAFSHSQGPLDFWVESNDISQFSRLSYNSYLMMRGLRILFDAVQAGIDDGGGTNAEVAAFWAALKASQQGADAWWVQDIRVYLYDQVTLALVTDLATENQWDGLMQSYGTFSWQTRAANQRVLDEIELQYNGGAGDPNALASINVADVSFNWPPHYNDPLGANGTTTVSAMLAR